MHKPRYTSQKCHRCGCHAGWTEYQADNMFCDSMPKPVCYFCVASEHALLLHLGKATRATPQDEYLSPYGADLYWQRQQECLNVGTNLRMLVQAMADNTELDFQLSIDYT